MNNNKGMQALRADKSLQSSFDEVDPRHFLSFGFSTWSDLFKKVKKEFKPSILELYK